MNYTTQPKRKLWQRFALGGLAVVLTAPAWAAQSAGALTPVPDGPLPEIPELPGGKLPKPDLPELEIPDLPNLKLPLRKFSCGPHLATFVVRSLAQVPGQGIRCVKFSNGSLQNSRTPRIAWYGEGNWRGKTYRHMGHAFYRGQQLLQGYASDMYGNGEAFTGNFNGNLKVQMINASRIRVTGAWNEEWVRVNQTNYQPLQRPRVCGQYFDQYRVSDLVPTSQGGRQGDGLRCVLRVGPTGTYAPKRFFTTWFGNGNWQGNLYSHVGLDRPRVRVRATSAVRPLGQSAITLPMAP